MTKLTDYEFSARKGTHELKEGDVIVSHGMLLKLGAIGGRDLQEVSYEARNYLQLTKAGFPARVYWSDAEILNTEEVDANGSVPRGWRKDNTWRVQGNAFAEWPVMIAK